MQTLIQSLQDHDRGQLRIIAEFWGIDLPRGPTSLAATGLAQGMLNGHAAQELAASLPPVVRAALQTLLARGGKMPMAELARRFGPLREMGPARRDRDKPWRNPASPLEALWYRGFIARAFADTPKGPQEFAFVPRDLAAKLPPAPSIQVRPFGSPVTTPDKVLSAGLSAVDDATTLLAALRVRPANSRSLDSHRSKRIAAFFHRPESFPLLISVLTEDRILAGSPCAPDPHAARQFLNKPRGHAQAGLLRAWYQASAWNDLAQVSNLRSPEGLWPNDPLISRRAALALLRDVPEGQWWSLEAFIQGVKHGAPDFLRPGSDFDSWYLQDSVDGTFLQGFQAWDSVEGGLLRYLITGPLHWLGAVDLGAASGELPFRITPWMACASERETCPHAPEPRRLVSIRSDGRIIVPRETARTYRYQISRFCAWSALHRSGSYIFQLTPASLAAAGKQGLRAKHVMAVLEESTAGRVPAKLKEAIERWSEAGVEARLRRHVLLQVKDPKVLDELRSNRATARFLKKALGPQAVAVHDSDWESLCAAALRAGLLIGRPDEQGAFSP